MKRITLILLSAILLPACLFGCTKKSVNIHDLKSFVFGYSTGTMMNSYVRYELRKVDGVWTATVKPDGVPEEEATVKAVDESFVRELEAVLNAQNIGAWNGFNKTDDGVMDGNGFHLNIYMNDGTSVSASGYMKWPDGYREASAAIAALFAAVL